MPPHHLISIEFSHFTFIRIHHLNAFLHSYDPFDFVRKTLAEAFTKSTLQGFTSKIARHYNHWNQHTNSKASVYTNDACIPTPSLFCSLTYSFSPVLSALLTFHLSLFLSERLLTFSEHNTHKHTFTHAMHTNTWYGWKKDEYSYL